MDKRTQRILIISTSVIALLGVGYFIYSRQQEKKRTEELIKSVNEMTTKYNVFN
jgi:preprotein translocase subunit YajC